MRNHDPTMPWNGMDKNDITKPWNDSVYKDDPLAPWNDFSATKEDFDRYKRDHSLSG